MLVGTDSSQALRPAPLYMQCCDKVETILNPTFLQPCDHQVTKL